MEWALAEGWSYCIFEMDCADLFSFIMAGKAGQMLINDAVRGCVATLIDNPK